MKNKSKIVMFPTVYKSARKTVTREDFLIALFDFLFQLGTIEDKQSFEEIVLENKKEIMEILDRLT